jgi:hypothetical protein
MGSLVLVLMAFCHLVCGFKVVEFIIIWFDVNNMFHWHPEVFGNIEELIVLEIDRIFNSGIADPIEACP